MLFLFRQNLFLNSLLLILYAILLRYKSFAIPFELEKFFQNSILRYDVFYWPTSTITNGVLSIILVFFHAVFINRMAIKNNYDRYLSLFPGLFYIFFISFLPDTLGCSDILLANTFLLLSINELNKVYKKYNPSKSIFNAGFFGCIAMLIYLPYVLAIPVLIICLYSLRAQNTKEMLQLLSGYGLVLFLFFSGLYISGHENIFFEYFNNMVSFPIFSIPLPWFNLAFIFGALVLVLFANRTLMIKKSVQVSKKINFFYYLLIFSSLVLIFGFNQYPSFKLLAILGPIGILTGLFLISIKNKIIVELLHLVLLGFLFVQHYNLLDLLQN